MIKLLEDAKSGTLETGRVLSCLEEFIDLLGNAHYLGLEKIVLSRDHLPEDFFTLESGMAGEVLQKFSNYGMKLDIRGDFSGYTRKSIRDFIRESNRTGHIRFIQQESE